LWECDLDDLDKLQFLVATNADWVHGGWHEVGKADGLEDVYATAFRNVGLRLRMDGVNLTEIWKSVPVRTYYAYPEKRRNPITGAMEDKIGIRLKDIPDMQAELYKVSTFVPSGADIFGCGRRSPRILYRCFEPNGYIQLAGPGLPHDHAGENARYRYLFYGRNNGLAWGMYNAISLSREPTCVVSSATPDVYFNTVTVQELQAGGEASARFSIEVDCNGGSDISGTVDNKTAIGLQVSMGAFTAAQALDLVRDGGVEYLLSDQYGAEGIAKGVGIGVYDANGQRRRFVGRPGTVGAGHPRGNGAGWYPVLQDAAQLGDALPGIGRHRLDFTARLMKLPQAQEIIPGRVHATVHVLVKVQ